MRVIIVLLVIMALASPSWSQCVVYSQLGGYLYSAYVVPPSGSSLSGFAWFSMCKQYAEFTLTLQGSETVTAVHVHGPAFEGEVAPIIRDLPVPAGELLIADLGPWTDHAWDVLGKSETYVDVHTVEFPEGAIRGQLKPRIAVESSPWSAVKQLFK